MGAGYYSYYEMMLNDLVVDVLLKGKTKSQRYTFYAVLAGKKKDRGHLVDKYRKEYQRQKDLMELIRAKVPAFGVLDKFLNGYNY
jgi:hypothetical protein